MRQIITNFSGKQCMAWVSDDTSRAALRPTRVQAVIALLQTYPDLAGPKVVIEPYTVAPQQTRAGSIAYLADDRNACAFGRNETSAYWNLVKRHGDRFAFVLADSAAVSGACVPRQDAPTVPIIV